jgi:L-alanine-DL-glutamate epimerase-like enolase superfamily enzyme
MNMAEIITKVEPFLITLPREVPYLGALREGEVANARGYMVRKGNRTVYPTFDRNVLVRIETQSGLVGWGETYGIIAPRATMALIADLHADFVVGRDAHDVTVIHDDLYNMMRVRGYTGGYYLDALAAIDIALWDICGQATGLPIAKLLGGQRRTRIPAYLSGLPEKTREARADLAKAWQEKGFRDVKFAAPVADDGLAAEMASLRAVLGSNARIACDMHWAHTAEQAIHAIRSMEPHGLWFAEAPVNPEDVEGLAHVAHAVSTPIAAGEEWRTVFDVTSRVKLRACGILQPEMGHCGITEFMRMAGYAQAHHLEIIPHATIGIGIFLAASLHASAAAAPVSGHEFQHSVFGPNRHLIEGDMDCMAGAYHVPTGAGLGVAPSAEAIKMMEKFS